jgi:hypothetical protein
VASGAWSLGYSAATTNAYGTPVLTWTGAGNVGIGTATPSAKLHINGVASSLLFSDGGAHNISTSGGTIYLYSVDTFAFNNGNYWRQNLPTDFDISYYRNGASSPYLTIKDGGNVGIGTATPTQKLHVYNAATSAADIMQIIEQDHTTYGAYLRLDRPSTARNASVQFATAGSIDWQIGLMYNGGSASSDWAITTDGSLTTAKLLVQATTGYVGIGTNAPASKLHVIAATEQLRLGNDATYYTSFTVDNAGDLTISPSGGDVIIPTNKKLNIGIADANGSCLSMRRTALGGEAFNYSYFTTPYDGCRGIHQEIYLTNASGSNYNIEGMRNYVFSYMTGTGTAFTVYGIRNIVRQLSANAVNDAFVVYGSHIQQDANTGTVVLGIGYYSSCYLYSGSTLTELRHVAATDAAGPGTLTTQYGLKIENLTKGATNWSIHTGTAPSLFGGAVQLASGSASAPSITFSADTNCGMYLSATDNLAFCTGGTRSFYIDSSQNLQISGDVRPVLTASFDIGLPHASNPQIWRNAYFTNLGVGITAAAPTAKAQIVGNSTQLILGYNATTVQTTFTVDSGGDLNVTPSGGFMVLNGKLVVTATGPNVAYISYQQPVDGQGGYMLFRGGTAGTTVRGYVGFTHNGAGSATLFTGETADYVALRGENGVHLGVSTNLYATLASSAITVADGINLAFNTTTGTKLGTATNQKLGFWNATPVIQQTTGSSAATFVQNSGNAVNDSSTFDGYTIAQMAKIIRTLGLAA